MKYLAPLPLKNSYWAHIEGQINAIFDEVIYNPIRKVLRKHGFELRNATDPLAEAIATERVFYQEGAFYGDFNSKISKALRALGAVYDGRKKAWVIALYNLPQEIQRGILQVQLRFQLLRQDIAEVIDTIDPKRIKPINYLPTVEQVQADLYRTLVSVAVPTVMSEKTKKRVAREWGENLDLYIKDWVGNNIIKLRQDVQSNTLAGGRAAALHDTLQYNYGTSKSKAKFLARQETSLMVSTLREAEYDEVGIEDYKWSVSGGEHPDERVRELHKSLNNKIFSFKNPPVSGTKGERQNPGCPFGCRCLAYPIWRGGAAKTEGGTEPNLAPEFTP